MKRYLVISAVVMLLALPVVAGAQSIGELNCRSWDDTGCMPAWWDPYPPASKTVDATQLMELLTKKGMITPQEAARLEQPQVATPGGQSREMAQEPSASPLTTP